jgi:hypothetical protein
MRLPLSTPGVPSKASSHGSWELQWSPTLWGNGITSILPGLSLPCLAFPRKLSSPEKWIRCLVIWSRWTSHAVSLATPSEGGGSGCWGLSCGLWCAV